MSRHESVSCDNCLQTNFEGIRYKCLMCYDYDLCEKCHSRGFTTGRHRSDHPMQCILTRLDADLFHRGESSGGSQDAYTCPFCGQYGIKGHDLGSHITSQHSGDSREVICPICAVSANTDPNLMTDNLANHMALEHAQAANPRRETIRQIRRMIYPSSRGSSNASRRTRATLSSREIPFMQFVSDMTSSGSSSGMDDSLAELLNHLSGTPRSNASSRPPQPNSGFIPPPSATQTKKDKSKNQQKDESRSISTRFLLDTLSDEEDSSPDEFTQQKCDFFQDLLLSTLTNRRLTLNIQPPEESESEISENEDPVGSSRLMKKCSKKSKDKGLKIDKSSENEPPQLVENNNNRSGDVISSDSDST